MCFKRSFLQFFVLVFLLITSCSKVEIKSPANCRLEKIETTGGGNTYLYNDEGYIVKKIQTGGASPDTSFYSYNSSGKIEKIAGNTSVWNYTYGSDGNVNTLTLSDESSNLIRTEVFSWYADSVVVVYTNAGNATPNLIRKYSFQGDNLTSQKDYVYSGGNLTMTQFWDYSNYETALNPYILLQEQTPGLPATVSKNVIKNGTITNTIYTSGTAGTPSVITIACSYTFQNNLPITEKDTYSSGEVYNTTFSYQCNIHD